VGECGSDVCPLVLVFFFFFFLDEEESLRQCYCVLKVRYVMYKPKTNMN